MWAFLCPRTGPLTLSGFAATTPPIETRHTAIEENLTPDISGEAASQEHEIFTGYESDQSEDSTDDTDDENGPDADDEHEPQSNGPGDSETPCHAKTPIPIPQISGFGILERKQRQDSTQAAVPTPKRRKRETPVRIQRNGRKNELFWIRGEAMRDLEKQINSARSNFDGGPNGLQARRARAIQSYLHMLVQNDRRKVEASERAAEAQGFAAQWGGRQVRSWAKLWIVARKLPESRRGAHIKLFTLLEDPEIRAELRSYVRSNKWAIDPAKLANFSTKKMVPKAADAYGTDLMKKEIPTGLKRYLELELFPRIQMKATRCHDFHLYTHISSKFEAPKHSFKS